MSVTDFDYNLDMSFQDASGKDLVKGIREGYIRQMCQVRV